MKLVGLLLALAGWLIPIVTVVLIQSTAVRMTVSILGIAMTLVGIATWQWLAVR